MSEVDTLAQISGQYHHTDLPFEELISQIDRLRQEKNAVVLAHNYQTPEVQDIADFTGDSLGLAVEASRTDADLIVFCGVHFMAESAKILSPKKTVLLPHLGAGCALSDSITPESLDEWKEMYPEHTVVTYVNSSAEVKAESDICCTSANAVSVVRSLNTDDVLFTPDRNLGRWVAQQIPEKNIAIYDGVCPTHDVLRQASVDRTRSEYPDAIIIAHPECPPDVIKASDFTGSTSGMIKYVKDNQPEKVMMVTECSMSDNVQVDNPNVKFIRPCNLCPHMKKITLPKILDCLENETNEIIMDNITIEKARNSVERMVKIGR